MKMRIGKDLENVWDNIREGFKNGSHWKNDWSDCQTKEKGQVRLRNHYWFSQSVTKCLSREARVHIKRFVNLARPISPQNNLAKSSKLLLIISQEKVSETLRNYPDISKSCEPTIPAMPLFFPLTFGFLVCLLNSLTVISQSEYCLLDK